jgi:Tol biopolymer transport system component
MVKMRRRLSVGLVLCLLVSILLSSACKAKRPVGPTDKLLATIPDRFEEVSQETFSPGGKQVAYIVNARGKGFVVLNDKPGPEYDYVNELQFSRNEERFAYVAGIGKRFFAVIDGKQELWSEVMTSVVLSQDGRHAAYDVKQAGKQFVVVDDVIGPRFDFVLDLSFAPDGDVVYLAKNGGQIMDGQGWVLMMGKDELPLVEGHPFGPTISPDFQTIAYVTIRNDGAHVVVNNKLGRAYHQIGHPLFSPNGKLLAYSASEKEGIEFLVILKAKSISENGEAKEVFEEFYKGAEFDGIGDLFFSADGSRFAYHAGKKGKLIIVTGDREFTDFDEAFSPVFSGDGTRLVYIAKQTSKEFVVVGDQKGPALDVVRDPIFSEDGKTVLYGARQGKQLWRKVMEVK